MTPTPRHPAHPVLIPPADQQKSMENGTGPEIQKTAPTTLKNAALIDADTAGFPLIPGDSPSSSAIAPDRPEERANGPRECQWPDCHADAGRTRHGYCRQHYLSARWSRAPLTHVRAAGHDSHTWKGESIGITAAHDRIRAVRGAAALYPCSAAGCPWQAEDWALIPGRGTHQSAKGTAYSTNPEDYLPLCRSCHRSTDAATARLSDHPALPFVGWQAEDHRATFDAAPRHERTPA